MNWLVIGFVLFGAILVGGAFSPLVFPVEPKAPVLFLQAQEGPVEIYDSDTNTIHSHYFDLTHRQDGALIIKKDGEKLSGQMFAITGTDNGQNMVKFSDDFDWTWNVETHNFNALGEIKQKYYLTANNNNIQFPIDQNWGAIYEANSPKVKYSLTNNFRELTNVKFWFIQVLKPNDLVEFDGVQRFLQTNGQVHLKEPDGVNLTEKLIKINNKMVFDFEDLNSTGWKTTDIYIGRADIINKPNLVIVGVAVTKNNGVFPLGASVELDPTIFSDGPRFFSKTSNNNGVEFPECLRNSGVGPRGCEANFNLNDSVDLNTPVLWVNLPSDINVVGFEVTVNAVAIGPLCPDPSPTATLRILLSGNAGDTSTPVFIGKTQTWDCEEGEVTKAFGASNDNWSALWDRDTNLSSDQFLLKISQSAQTTGGDFDPFVNWVKIEIFYTKKCVFNYPDIPPQDPFPFDCNCDGDTFIGDTTDVEGEDFNISNVNGIGTLEIHADVNDFGRMYIENGCRVEIFTPFTVG